MEYESFTFEKVTIEDAIAAKKAEDEPVKEDVNWAFKRRQLLSSEMKLQNETCAWLVALPERVRPLHLARKFPRIANQLASAWTRPVVCDQIFDELMLDHRGKRQGFPLEIAREITELRAYFSTEVFVVKQDAWTLTL